MFKGQYLRKLRELNATILDMVTNYIYLHVARKLLGSERVVRGPLVEITWNDPAVTAETESSPAKLLYV